MANSKLNKIVTKVMDDIQDGTTKGKHCPYCGEKIIYTKNKITGNMVPCRCKCEEKREKEEEKRRIEEERKNLIIKAKYECFNHKSMWKQTFEKDKGLNAKMYVAKDYVANWEKMYEHNCGLMLIGNVGTGKSYMASAIANALIEKGVKVKFTSFIEITNDIFSASDKTKYVKSLNKYDLLIIDDVGTERNTEYTLENIYWVIDERVSEGKPLIITTNTDIDKKENDENFNRRRINSRIRNVCIPVDIPNYNIRETMSKKHNETCAEIFWNGGGSNGKE